MIRASAPKRLLRNNIASSGPLAYARGSVGLIPSRDRQGYFLTTPKQHYVPHNLREIRSAGARLIELKVHHDVAAFNLHRISLHATIRIEVILSGRAVELPAVPRTRDVLPVDRAMAQRTALVRARPPKRVHFAAHMAKRDRVSADHYLDRAIRRKLRQRQYFHERHIPFLHSIELALNREFVAPG